MLRAHAKEEASDDTLGLAARTDALVRQETARAEDRFEEALPTQIGPFRIVRRIATGGMGTVCEAEQEQPKRRVDLICKVADALSHAHDSAILHRDIKPSNILVTAAGEPRLLDFGIARAISDDATQQGLTSSGMFMGTLNYMSPEQAKGSGAPPDVRADLYGLAAVGYELLAKRPPHDFRNRALHEATADLLQKSVTQLRAIESEIPADLSAIFAKALSIEPERRYATVRQFADDLRRYRADETVRARPPSRIYRAQKFVRRHRIPVALGFAVVAALVAGLIVALAQKDRTEAALAESQRLRRLSDAQHRAAETESALHAVQAGDLPRAAALLRTMRLGNDAPLELRYLDARLRDAISVEKVRAERWYLSRDGRYAVAHEPIPARRLHVIDVASGEQREVDLSSYPPLQDLSSMQFLTPATVAVSHIASGVTAVDVPSAKVIRHVVFDSEAPPVWYTARAWLAARFPG